ncbi:glycosyltransferase [Mucilaginibacter celer]|uniref:Glycosyltransferase n=1 Tax=Mucilaginibacter celer TaxID=2305508 RepID=A0A494VPZ6_9SPHI|nr:glycosyltransferase family A protein [Mucilaginibacter celer]AYL95260.1 glycosyltransferase [Mucilaginibacter celer]
MSNKFISVIIPTYKDWNRLALCISALNEQSYNQAFFEIIIVNNYTADKVPANYFLPSNCKVITEGKPGSYAARNTGIALSTGEILAFTDSDCIPEREWIANAVRFLEADIECTRLAGRINLYYHSKKLTGAELYEKVYAFNQDLYVNQDGTSVTGNMFSYRLAFDTVGLFKEDLMSGGDYEWSVRARDAGFKIKYADDVVVNHPARHTMAELIKKAKRVGGGQAGLDTPPPGDKLKPMLRLVYDLRPPVRSIKLIATKGKGMHIMQMVFVFYIRYYLSVITAREKFMVSIGRSARRS